MFRIWGGQRWDIITAWCPSRGNNMIPFDWSFLSLVSHVRILIDCLLLVMSEAGA